MKKDRNTGANGKVYGGSREHHLIAELSNLARNGPTADQSLRRSEAEAHWSSMRLYPLLMLAGLLSLSAGFSSFCFTGGVGSYIGVGVLFLGLMGTVMWFNSKHREAYVARQMANGVSRADAERDYSNRYDGS
jgi:hypothetical protein